MCSDFSVCIANTDSVLSISWLRPSVAVCTLITYSWKRIQANNGRGKTYVYICMCNKRVQNGEGETSEKLKARLASSKVTKADTRSQASGHALVVFRENGFEPFIESRAYTHILSLSTCMCLSPGSAPGQRALTHSLRSPCKYKTRPSDWLLCMFQVVRRKKRDALPVDASRGAPLLAPPTVAYTCIRVCMHRCVWLALRVCTYTNINVHTLAYNCQIRVVSLLKSLSISLTLGSSSRLYTSATTRMQTNTLGEC